MGKEIYIPKDLNDCFDQIDKFWDDKTKDIAKNMPEDDFSASAHHGFGRWIRNNWELWKGSRLSLYFNNVLLITHPDDMSGIILDSYHRYLNGKELKLKEQVKYYHDYWEKLKKNEENLNNV